MYMHLQHPEMATVYALPQYLLAYLPEWLGGVGIAGLVLTAIGSIAGIALGIGTMLSRDIFKTCLGVEDQGKLLTVNRVLVVTVTLLAIVVAMFNLDSLILEWNYLSMALRASAVWGPGTRGGWAPKLAHSNAGFYSMIAGVVVALCWRLIVPDGGNALFPSLAANLIFLIPGIILAHKS